MKKLLSTFLPTYYVAKHKYKGQTIELDWADNDPSFIIGIGVGFEKGRHPKLLIRRIENNDSSYLYCDSKKMVEEYYPGVKLFDMPFVPGFYAYYLEKQCRVVKFDRNELKELISKLEL